MPNNFGVIDSNICSSNNKINGYECSGFNYSVLRFTSQAFDSRLVMNIPVTIIGSSGFSNPLNMLMEWEWDANIEPLDTRL